MESLRTFQYRPATHTYLFQLKRKVDGVSTNFDAFTTLVARGPDLIGWLNLENTIEPMFVCNNLAKYDLDYRTSSQTNEGQLRALGVYNQYPVGPANFHPIRKIHYRPRVHTNLAILKRKVNARLVEFDEETTLLARAADLFGWLDIDDNIEPIFLRGSLTMYDLDEHMPRKTSLGQLIDYGVYKRLPTDSFRIEESSRSRSRSRSRSPSRNRSGSSGGSRIPRLQNRHL